MIDASVVKPVIVINIGPKRRNDADVFNRKSGRRVVYEAAIKRNDTVSVYLQHTDL